MKSYRGISLRYLKRQKRQSKFIMIAIILAVILITAILSGFLTFNNIQKENALSILGNYNSRIINLTKDEIKELNENNAVDKLGTETFIEQISLTDLSMINLFSYDDDLMDIKVKTVESGTLPKDDNEIALEKWVLDLLGEDIKIGETILLNVNDKKESFKLVGLIRSNLQNSVAERIATGVVSEEALSRFEPINHPSYNSYILIKDELDDQKTIKEIIYNFDMSNKTLEENTLLLNANLEGKSNDNLILLISVGFICFIVICVAITVIHNAVSILVLERIKHLGILRAIGGAKKQIKKILRIELLTLALMAVPIGIVIGLLLLKGILIIINSSFTMNFKLIVNPYIILFTICVATISVLISSRGPLVLAGKISPIKVINNSNNIKKENINKRRGFIYRHLSIVGKITHKNMKRNKKRFRNTLISITLSITLFITFYSLINYGFEILDFTNNKGDFQSDLRISSEVIVGSEGKDNSSFIEEYGFTDEYYNALKNINGVEYVYKRNLRYVVSSFKHNKLNNEYLTMASNNNSRINTYNNGEYFFTTSSGFYGYSDEQIESCNEYINEGEIDINKMNSDDGVLITQNSLILDSNSNKTKNVTISDFEIGDEIYLDFNLSTNTISYEEELNNKNNIDNNLFKKVKIMGIISEVPYDRKAPSGGLGIIATDKTYFKLTGRNQTTGYDIKIKDDISKESISEEIKNISNNTPNSVFTNLNEVNKSQKQYYIQISILLYGIAFIVFIIGLLNISNTINTNILLKTKEFATLKSIGITQSQLKQMVLLESSYYGVLGAIYGSIIGSLISFGVYKVCFELVKTFFINGSITEFTFRFPLTAIVLARSVTIFACAISSISPLRRLGNINIVNSINTN